VSDPAGQTPHYRFKKMNGTLYLIPNTLGPTDSLDQVIPQHVQQLTSQLTHFVAENAKPPAPS